MPKANINKNCPFCGYTVTQVNVFGNKVNPEVFISCINCGCETRLFSTEDKAYEAWNRRVRA